MLDAASREGPTRRALLLAVALAADVGGIATPIGTGPNGIAIAVVERQQPMTFAHRMVFGVPLAAGLVAASLALITLRVRPTGRVALPEPEAAGPAGRLLPRGLADQGSDIPSGSKLAQGYVLSPPSA